MAKKPKPTKGTDPKFKKQEKYRSGNEGKLHPGLKHKGGRYGTRGD